MNLFDLILFGGTGDLAMRKLMPALYRRVSAGQIARARASSPWRAAATPARAFARKSRRSVARTWEPRNSPEHWHSFVALVDYISVNATVPEDFDRLAAKLNGSEDRCA